MKHQSQESLSMSQTPILMMTIEGGKTEGGKIHKASFFCTISFGRLWMGIYFCINHRELGRLSVANFPPFHTI